jgi:hypothetical protein
MRTAPPGLGVNRRPIALGAVVLALAGCGTAAAHTASPARPAAAVSATPSPSTATGILTGDGWTPLNDAGAGSASALSAGQVSDGFLSVAAGNNGVSAEEVIVLGGRMATAKFCGDLARYLQDQYPGTRVSASGTVIRITGPVAAFRQDGLSGV